MISNVKGKTEISLPPGFISPGGNLYHLSLSDLLKSLFGPLLISDQTSICCLRASDESS